MEPLSFERSRFRLSEFLSALHRFSLANGSDGDPLPVVVGDIVCHDPVELAEALADEGEAVTEIPNGSLARLESRFTLFAPFTAFDGYAGLDCADGSRLRDDEAVECGAVGVTISLVVDEVEIEGRVLSDASGECALEPLDGQDRVGKRMRRWIRSFVIKSESKK